jgi:hypothetical protein
VAKMMISLVQRMELSDYDDDMERGGSQQVHFFDGKATEVQKQGGYLLKIDFLFCYIE